MCAARDKASPASWRASPSTTMTCDNVSAPPPPYSSGKAIPAAQASNLLDYFAREALFITIPVVMHKA